MGMTTVMKTGRMRQVPLPMMSREPTNWPAPVTNPSAKRTRPSRWLWRQMALRQASRISSQREKEVKA
jgi:hypothetical protein